MAWSIFDFVADSADAQLAYERVVLLLVFPPPPHAAIIDSILPKETPSARARNMKSRRLILPAVNSCTSLSVSFIDITPIVVKVTNMFARRHASVYQYCTTICSNNLPNLLRFEIG